MTTFKTAFDPHTTKEVQKPPLKRSIFKHGFYAAFHLITPYITNEKSTSND